MANWALESPRLSQSAFTDLHAAGVDDMNGRPRVKVLVFLVVPAAACALLYMLGTQGESQEEARLQDYAADGPIPHLGRGGEDGAKEPTRKI